MTKQYENMRRENMRFYGFGTEAMKDKKICAECGAVAESSLHFCYECGAELPKETMYEAYAKRHRRCRKCGTVVSNSTNFCPDCGEKI